MRLGPISVGFWKARRGVPALRETSAVRGRDGVPRPPFCPADIVPASSRRPASSPRIFVRSTARGRLPPPRRPRGPLPAGTGTLARGMGTLAPGTAGTAPVPTAGARDEARAAPPTPLRLAPGRGRPHAGRRERGGAGSSPPPREVVPALPGAAALFSSFPPPSPPLLQNRRGRRGPAALAPPPAAERGGRPSPQARPGAGAAPPLPRRRRPPVAMAGIEAQR